MDEKTVPKKKSHKKRNLGIAAGVLLGITAFAGHTLFKSQGESLNNVVDGQIDSQYYSELCANRKETMSVEQIADLLAETHYMNTGKSISEYRFNEYDEKHSPLRIKLTEAIGDREGGIRGLNWGNGDVYINKNNKEDALGFILLAFHEMGHDKYDSIIDHANYLMRSIKSNQEPIAEKNAIDSIIASMYLNPELGYCLFERKVSIAFNQPGNIIDKKNECGKWNSRWYNARLVNVVKFINGNKLEIKPDYESDETVQKLITKQIEGLDDDTIVSKVYSGVLSEFKQRFESKPDFNEKYSKLSDYFKYGNTSYFYDKSKITKEELGEQIKQKEEFLSRQTSPLIKRNIEKALNWDKMCYGKKQSTETP
jgi:hypothetical protein